MLARLIKNQKVRHVITAALTAATIAGLQAAGVPFPDWASAIVTTFVGN